MKKKDRVVILFGFSGSGKTMIAKMIARRYGLRLIHPSGILRSLLQGKKINIKKTISNSGFWESNNGIALLRNRLKENIPPDVVSDRILLREIARGGVVMDSWNMPWLNASGQKIYLRAPLSVRAQRVAERSKISTTRARLLVRTKDEETRKMFKRVYGFDIKNDTNVFDHILDTGMLDKKQVLNRIIEFLEHGH